MTIMVKMENEDPGACALGNIQPVYEHIPLLTHSRLADLSWH